MGFPSGRRRVVTALAAVLAVGVAAAIVYRVLAPAEVSTVARGAYPAAASPPVGVIGPAAGGPADRGRPAPGLRRHPPGVRRPAGRRRSTGSPRSGRTGAGRPSWSAYWPAAPPWSAAGPTGTGGAGRADRAGRLAGRRAGAGTGAEAPAHLRLDGLGPGRAARRPTADGRAVLVAAGERQAGRVRHWPTAGSSGGSTCRAAAVPTWAPPPTGELIGVDACAMPTTVEFRDAATGAVRARWLPPGGGRGLAVTPLGCADGALGVPGPADRRDGRRPRPGLAGRRR